MSIHFLFLTEKGDRLSNWTHLGTETAPQWSVSEALQLVSAPKGWISFSRSLKRKMCSVVGGPRRGSKQGISRNNSNLLWVTDEVTTGLGADSCLWHPRPHVKYQSWNLIYWGTGCDNILNTLLLYSEITRCFCSNAFFLYRNVSCNPKNLIFPHRRLAGNDLSFIHPEALSGLYQLKVL